MKMHCGRDNRLDGGPTDGSFRLLRKNFVEILIRLRADDLMVTVDDKGWCRVYIKFLLTFKPLFDETVNQLLVLQASFEIRRVDPTQLATSLLEPPISLSLFESHKAVALSQ